MKKKILVIIKYLKLGGTEKRLLRIIKHLPEDNYEFFFLCSNNGHNEKLLNSFMALPNVKFIGYNKNLFFKLLELIRNNYDISLAIRNFFGLFISILLRVNKKICLEGGNRGISRPFYKKLLDKMFVFRFADSIFANSEYIKNVMIESGCPAHKIRVIKNGIEDIDKFELVNIPDENFLSDGLNCVTVSRLEWEKNISELIQIFECLIDFKIKLFIIGDGSQYNILKKMVQDKNLSERIVFCGRKNENEIISYMLKCHIFVYVSVLDSLPNACIEALRCSLPIIAYNNTGMNEIVIDGYNGFLISNGDSNLFKQKIIEVYHNRHLLSIMRQNARKSYLENFTISRMIREIDEYFEN